MSEHWEHVAPIWHLLERKGLTPQLLDRFTSWLIDPVLVVGGGQGLLVEGLRERGLDRVEGLDGSPAMIRYARERRGVELALADATDIPAKDHSYSSVVIATAVLSRSDRDEAIVREALRVLIPGGSLIIALFAPNQELVDVGASLGIFEQNHYLQHRIYEIWRAGREHWLESVRGWIDSDELRTDQLDLLATLHNQLDFIAEYLGGEGVPAEEILREAFNWELGFFGPDEATSLVESCGLEVLASEYEVDTLVLACGRQAQT